MTGNISHHLPLVANIICMWRVKPQTWHMSHLSQKQDENKNWSSDCEMSTLILQHDTFVASTELDWFLVHTVVLTDVIFGLISYQLSGFWSQPHHQLCTVKTAIAFVEQLAARINFRQLTQKLTSMATVSMMFLNPEKCFLAHELIVGTICTESTTFLQGTMQQKAVLASKEAMHAFDGTTSLSHNMSICVCRSLQEIVFQLHFDWHSNNQIEEPSTQTEATVMRSFFHNHYQESFSFSIKCNKRGQSHSVTPTPDVMMWKCWHDVFPPACIFTSQMFPL